MNGKESVLPDISERFDAMTKYLNISIECFGEKRACRMMRSHLGWFVKGLHHSSRFRESIKKISTEREALSLIGEFKSFLSDPSNIDI